MTSENKSIVLLLLFVALMSSFMTLLLYGWYVEGKMNKVTQNAIGLLDDVRAGEDTINDLALIILNNDTVPSCTPDMGNRSTWREGICLMEPGKLSKCEYSEDRSNWNCYSLNYIRCEGFDD